MAEGLKRTWGNSLNSSVAPGKLNLATSGVLLLTFMTIKPFQFRFSDTQAYHVRAPEYLVNMWTGTNGPFLCRRMQTGRMAPFISALNVKSDHNLWVSLNTQPAKSSA